MSDNSETNQLKKDNFEIASFNFTCHILTTENSFAKFAKSLFSHLGRKHLFYALLFLHVFCNQGKALREFSSTPGLDAIRFFDLALFCYLTGNSDMHLKNFSLLRHGNGSYQLAPAYDLVLSQIILPEDKEEFALTLNGRKAKIRRHDFEAFGQTIKLTDMQIRNAIKRIISNGNKSLPEALGRSFLPDDKQKEISKLFAERMKKLLS